LKPSGNISTQTFRPPFELSATTCCTLVRRNFTTASKHGVGQMIERHFHFGGLAVGDSWHKQSAQASGVSEDRFVAPKGISSSSLGKRQITNKEECHSGDR